MPKFKAGDRVRVISNSSSNGNPVGSILTISSSSSSYSSYCFYCCFFKESSLWNYESELELLNNDSSEVKKDGQTNMINIKEKFTLVFKGEPEKTFRKVGITNGDDFLTDDGMKIFLGWLLKKHGEDFKKEVADDLLVEVEKESK